MNPVSVSLPPTTTFPYRSVTLLRTDLRGPVSGAATVYESRHAKRPERTWRFTFAETDPLPENRVFVVTTAETGRDWFVMLHSSPAFDQCECATFVRGCRCGHVDGLRRLLVFRHLDRKS